MSLTDKEYDILDECYFINSYEAILSEVQMNGEEFRELIVSLLNRGYIQQLLYNKEHNDYDKQEEFNAGMIEVAKYVITKQGLLIHNGRE